MTRLESWLTDATRGLSKDSGAQVRSEIGEHYESSLKRDVTPDEADRIAVAALGDAKAANRQYRKVLLTSSEARMLRQSKREARAFCSVPLLKGLLIAVSVVVLFGAGICFRVGAIFLAQTFVLGWVVGQLTGLRAVPAGLHSIAVARLPCCEMGFPCRCAGGLGLNWLPRCSRACGRLPGLTGRGPRSAGNFRPPIGPGSCIFNPRKRRAVRFPASRCPSTLR